jgi:hypothetical protein
MGTRSAGATTVSAAADPLDRADGRRQEEGHPMELGPVQVVVVGFTDDEFASGILPELRRLRNADAIRLIDVTFVSKDDDGALTAVDVGNVPDVTDEEWPGFGEIAAALMGLRGCREEGLSVGAVAGAGDGAQVSGSGEAWAISDAIPAGTSALVAVIEHQWAIPLRAAISRGGGFALEDTWVRRADLIAAGAGMTGGTQHSRPVAAAALPMPRLSSAPGDARSPDPRHHRA